ncbi:putrescine hydroxycinnamoyltransferase 1-like isoform X1 [Triticum dicoccoides]|uniref:putrescine hydroxycinnamoyltransferase 1-like isoform X1 n=1 Tax=Triticum dicoccoides TaxID=85692 RepID=UPI001891D237|nr:putrescine hydroxycinnamoyltransferase 1-like isoform X1 [Triticum dicoccoides]
MAGEEEVQVVESCFVTPAVDTLRKALWLSALDLMLANRGYTPLVHFYRRCPGTETTDDFFSVTKLKTALGKALVGFYPMAGRLRVDADGRLEIDCNSKGMLFLVARSQLTIDDFSDLKPSPRLRRLFVPQMLSAEVCATQVTFFKCGGVALGTAVHHGTMDGISTFHFFQTWSTFSRDGDRAVVKLPYHDRTHLCARYPPAVHPDTLSLFCLKINLSQPLGAVVNEVFTLRKDQLSTLKRICGGSGVSTFSAVSAHLWQCMCLARQLPPNSTTRLAFAANIRRAMTPPFPDGYFGNAVINVSVADEARGIASGDLAYIAHRIKDTLGRVDDELVRSAVDYLELDQAKRDNSPAIGNLLATDMRVVSWLSMPLYDVDFSWGKPLAVLRAESNRGGFAHLVDSAHGDGSVHIVMCIDATILKEFKRLLYAKFESMVYSKF